MHSLPCQQEGDREIGRVPGIILAGGRATRMGGGDKGLRLLAGRPILTHVIGRLAPQVGALALNANGDPARFCALFRHDGRVLSFPLPVLCDSVPGQPGPLAGILAGMEWAAGLGAGSVVTVAGDSPFLPSDLVARLEAAARPGRPALAASPDADGRLRLHPVFAVWPVQLRHDLRRALEAGERKVRRWAEAQGALTVTFGADPVDPFFNVNSPQDLERAEAVIAEVGLAGG